MQSTDVLSSDDVTLLFHDGSKTRQQRSRLGNRIAKELPKCCPRYSSLHTLECWQTAVVDQAGRGSFDLMLEILLLPVGSLLVKLAGHDLLYGEHDAVLSSDGYGGAAVLHDLPRILYLEHLDNRRKLRG